MIRYVALGAASTLSQIRWRQTVSKCLQATLGSLPLETPRAADAHSLRVNLANWAHPSARLPNFDRLFSVVDKAGDFRLVLSSRDWPLGGQSAYQILNRYQRLLPAPVGARTWLLELLPVAQTGDEELARSSTLDGWRWLHRLRPRPTEGLERAALLGESADDQDQALLDDTRDLAFFNTTSWWFLERHGLYALRSELERRFARMSGLALGLALTTRQPPAVAGLFEAITRGRTHSALGSTPWPHFNAPAAAPNWELAS